MLIVIIVGFSKRRSMKHIDKVILYLIIPILGSCNYFNRHHSENSLNAAYLDSATHELLAGSSQRVTANMYGFQADEVITYPDSIYQSRYLSIATDIPVVYNEFVKDYIEMYALREKELLDRMVGKSRLYYPQIEVVLDRKKMPIALKHLAMVESALNPAAASRRSAVGLWQLTFPTASSMGLHINDYVDERMNPVLATEAATKYLTKLYNIYHDWLLAIAAYNCGPGNVNKAIARMGGYTDFWQLYPHLPRETRGYVPAFMAITYLMEYQEEHNVRPADHGFSAQAFDTTRVFQSVTLPAIAAATGMAVEELRTLNPAILQDFVPASRWGTVINLPVNKLAIFERENARLLASKDWKHETMENAITAKMIKPKVPDDPTMVLISHQVKSGNTLIGIANRYKCSVQDLMSWNGLKEPVIRYGESLNVYVNRK